MKLKEQIKEVVEAKGYYLYDVHYDTSKKDHILSVLIDHDNGINIDDCVTVSSILSEKLDEWDPYSEPYMLEVTSPGAERELRTDDEISRSVGKPVHVETMEQTFEGVLLSYQRDVLEIKQKDKKIAKVNIIDVSLIRLAIIL